MPLCREDKDGQVLDLSSIFHQRKEPWASAAIVQGDIAVPTERGRWGFKALKSNISAGWKVHAQETHAFVSELRVSGTTERRKWDLNWLSWVLTNGGGTERTWDLRLLGAGLPHTIWSLLVPSIYLFKSHNFIFLSRWGVFNSVLYPFLFSIHQL